MRRIGALALSLTVAASPAGAARDDRVAEADYPELVERARALLDAMEE